MNKAIGIQIGGGITGVDIEPDTGIYPGNPVQSQDSAKISQEIVRNLIERMSNLERSLTLKVDSDKARAAIILSEEDIALTAENISLVGNVTFAKWLEGVSGGIDEEHITTITGNVVRTGVIESFNWGTTAGSQYDLDTGTITLGGSAAPNFSVDGSGNVYFNGTITTGSVVEGTGYTLQDIVNDIGTSFDLQGALDTGVGYILAGVGGNYELKVDDTANQILLYHKDAVYNGTAATGSVKHALAITANGIAMGYNRSDTGAWVNSVAIDASGNASFAGALSAATGTFAGELTAATGSFTGAITATSGTFTGSITATSIISGSCVVNGQTLDDTTNKSSLGFTHSLVTHAPSDADHSETILANSATSITMSSSALFRSAASGARVFIGSGGLFGKDASENTTFSIDATDGSAFFAGTLSAASGTLGSITGGTINTTGYIKADGTVTAPTLATIHGVAGASFFGVAGEATSGTGLTGQATASGGIGVFARGSGGANALWVEGPIVVDSTTKVDKLNADTVDGYHASAFSTLGHTHWLDAIYNDTTGTYKVKFRYSTSAAPTTWNDIYLWRYNW